MKKFHQKKVLVSDKIKKTVPCILCNNESPGFIFRKAGFNIMRCPFCGLAYLGNPPDESELKKLYSFDSDYHTQFKMDNHQSERHEFNLVKERLELLKRFKTGGRILDIGCSAGFFLKMARDSGWETHGVEISADTAKIARERYKLDVSTGTIEEVNFVPGSFDVVMMWDVIEHTKNPLSTMLAVSRMLEPDGLVILSTPNIDGLFPRLSYKVSKIVNYWPHPEPPHHLYQFSKGTITRLLAQARLVPVEIIDKRYSIPYTFGNMKSVVRSPKRLLYAAVFLPVMLLGPAVHAGDEIFVVARKDTATNA